MVAASLPAPAATSQTKWRSEAACRDGRATTPLAIPRGGGGSAASLPPSATAATCTGLLWVLGWKSAWLRSGTGDARLVPCPPPSLDAVARDQSGQKTSSGGLQDLGEGSLPREGEEEEEEEEGRVCRAQSRAGAAPAQPGGSEGELRRQPR